MSSYKTIQTLYNSVKSNLDSINDKNNASIIFSFNGVGKTRLSNEFSNLDNDVDFLRVLSYNAFFEDYFNWDNERLILILEDSWIKDLILKQELQFEIINNFQTILNTKLEPNFEIDLKGIAFSLPTGDDNNQDHIKISRGEESMFIWIVFYTVLETAINSLNSKEDDRPTDFFNNLEYIVIDDPVSSLDDTKLITLAVSLIDLIENYKGDKKLKFLITTHHALFYNIFYSSFKFDNFKRITQILSKENYKFKLTPINDSPFSYHHDLISKIQIAINENKLEKYHFNLFRTLLEKTSSFVGFEKWENCITINKKTEIVRLLNSFSHDRLIDLESKKLKEEHKDLFKEAFNQFIEDYKFNIKNE